MANFNTFKYASAFLVVIFCVGVEIASGPGSSSSSNNRQDEALAEIKHLNYPLSTDTINYFIEFANDYNKKKFRMAPCNMAPDSYKNFQTTKRDGVQILFVGDLEDPYALGHFICVSHKHSEKKVYIYNSLGRRRIPPATELANKNLFPNATSTKLMNSQTHQTDSVSCGLFAIAHATEVMLGYLPELCSVQLSTGQYPSAHLREHLQYMIEHKVLELFPSAGFYAEWQIKHF
ncbi:uncharacterized protein LOC116351231 [Contarinia nasturtii]|uniref:uncharacterized protein LOC116351231 n=1 Tax=Contarinia nasturtii TaxID=265458 RepID=UPI0012D3ADFD|nr:uncharacterized protein LOC116351231 [Contarinia nasturtii]